MAGQEASKIFADLTVLLVEDEPDDVLMFEKQVEGVSLEVLRAASLKEAHKMGGVDLCVLDLNIEDTVGADTIKQFRRGFPHIPVVVLSHIDDPIIEAACLSYGAYHYLRKEEITPKKLLRAMEAAVLAHRRHVEDSEELRATADYLARCELLVERIKERMDALRTQDPSHLG